MPYGVKKSEGGDNASNDAYMERLVAELKAKGHDEVSAIRIAKASLDKHRPRSLGDYLDGR